MSFLCIGGSGASDGTPALNKRRRSYSSAEKPTHLRKHKSSPLKPGRASYAGATSLDDSPMGGIAFPTNESAPLRANGGSLPVVVIAEDFVAETKDELNVRRGQMVKVLQSTSSSPIAPEESDWIYVKSGSATRGYVPTRICVPVFMWNSSDGENDDDSGEESVNFYSSTPKSKSRGGQAISRACVQSVYSSELTVIVRNRAHTNNASSHAVESARVFDRRPQGFALALYSYRARMEDDLPVQRGDWLVILNAGDRNWLWVRRRDGLEGFVPRSYVSRLDERPRLARKPPLKHYRSDGDLIGLAAMVVDFDYDAVHPSAVSISRGEIVYADLTSKTTNGWLWVNVPTRNREGFIPSTFVRPLTSSV